MAQIALSEDVPSDIDGTIHFSLANSEIEFDAGSTAAQDAGEELVREARVHPWLVVIEDEPVAEEDAPDEEPAPPALVFATPEEVEADAPAETTDSPFTFDAAPQEN